MDYVCHMVENQRSIGSERPQVILECWLIERERGSTSTSTFRLDFDIFTLASPSTVGLCSGTDYIQASEFFLYLYFFCICIFSVFVFFLYLYLYFSHLNTISRHSLHPQGINAKIDTNRVVYDSDASTRFEFEVMLVFCMYIFSLTTSLTRLNLNIYF